VACACAGYVEVPQKYGDGDSRHQNYTKPLFLRYVAEHVVVAVIYLVPRTSQIVHRKAPEMEWYRPCLLIYWWMHVACEICINIRVSVYKQKRHLYCKCMEWIRTGFCVVHEVCSFYFWPGV
jgi:hypothetical protein